MKQAEKLDKILRYLYDNKYSGNYYSVEEICDELKIPYSMDECWQLGKRLSNDGYVMALGAIGDMSVQINTYGIDYVERDSYDHPGNAISETHYHNYNISDSINTSIVTQSSNVSVNQVNSQVEHIIKQISDALEKENVDDKNSEEIKECLQEIQHNEKIGGKSKSAYKSLVGLTSNFSSIGSFVINLGKALGIID